MGEADLTMAAQTVLYRVVTHRIAAPSIAELLAMTPRIEIVELVEALQELLDAGLIMRRTAVDSYLYGMTIAGYKFVFAHLSRSPKTNLFWSVG